MFKRMVGPWILTATLIGVHGASAAAKPPGQPASMAQAPKSQTLRQAAHQNDLHKRIQAAYDAPPPSDAKEELAALEPLMREARAVKGIDPNDFANLSLIYALALYHNERVKDASDTIAQALIVYERAGFGDTAQLSDLLKNQAVYLNASGRPYEAIEMQKRALEVISRRGGADGQQAGAILASMAFAYTKIGRLQDALKTYERAMARMTAENGMAGSYSGHLGNYAGQLSYVGDYDRAVEMSQKSLEVALKNLPENNRAVRWAYSKLGDQLSDLGRNTEAEIYSRKALELAVAHTGKVSSESGAFGYNLSRVLHRMGRTEEAEALALNALEVVKQKPPVNTPDTIGIVWMELGDLAFERGDLKQAEDRFHQGLASIEPLGIRGVVTRCAIQTRLSSLLLVQGRRDAALETVRQALPYYRKEYPLYAKARLDAEMLEALILSRQGKANEAFKLARPLEEAMRERLLSAQLTVRERAELAEVYRNNFARFADIALSAGQLDVAFDAVQLAGFSENAVNAHMMARRVSLPNPRTQALFADLEATQALIFRLERERAFALGKSDEVVADVQTQLAHARQTLVSLNAALNAEVPDFKDLMQPSPMPLEIARASLGSKEALLMPVSVDDQFITMVLTPKGLIYDVAPINRSVVRAYVESLRLSLKSGETGGAFDEVAALGLGQAIFTDRNMRALKGIEDVAILGAGPVMRVPFALLLTRSGGATPAYAIRRFGFSVKPALLMNPPPKALSSGFAGIGAPILGPEAPTFELPASQALFRGGKVDADLIRLLPGLPLARTELERLRTALNEPDSLLILGDQANETTVKATALDRYGIVAFATHGLMGGDLKSLSEPALVLTPPEEATAEDDGLLTASEVAGLKLNAQWVILSACNSGAEREAGAGVYSGLAQGFIQAGGRNLLVSLWPVRDDVAEHLSVETVRFHKRGLSKSQALRRAMLNLMRNPRVDNASQPVIWAPFSLISQ